jgi:siderophore synthetase component
MSRSTKERALFATSSRLLASLINERLVRASVDSPKSITVQSLEDRKIDHTLRVLLVHPVPKGVLSTLDPEFIKPFQIFENGVEVLCPVQITYRIWENCTEDIRQQLLSSVTNQEWIFNNLPTRMPTLLSSAIEWEQYLIEGHPTHPMHRTRIPFDDQQSLLGSPCIKFISIPRSKLVVHGEWESIVKEYLPPPDSPDTLILPVHELQVSHVLTRIPSAILIPNFERRALAQSSLRTLSPSPASDFPGYHFKMALTILTTGAWRTISCYSVFNGPRVTQLAKFIAPKCLVVIGEVASIGSNSTDESINKHIACIIREDPEVLMPNESIVAQALVEKTLDGSTNMVRSVFGHCLIQNQINRLVHALDLHNSQTGWTIVRKIVEKYIRQAANIWFKETVPFKAFLRMKLADKYRDYIYNEIPNVLAMETIVSEI